MKEFVADNQSINANSASTREVRCDAASSTHTRWIINVGFANATSSGGNYANCLCSSSWFDGSVIKVVVRNVGSTTARIKINCRTIWISTTID